MVIPALVPPEAKNQSRAPSLRNNTNQHATINLDATMLLKESTRLCGRRGRVNLCQPLDGVEGHFARVGIEGANLDVLAE